MDTSLKEIIKSNAFETVTRLEAARIDYPPLLYSTQCRLLRKQPTALTDITTLKKMPSRSACNQMAGCCKKGNFPAVSCTSGTFTGHSLAQLIQVHNLHDIKIAVKEEQQWLAKKIHIPNSKCSYSKELMEVYKKKIFDSPDGHIVLDNNRYILASDMATLAGNGWLHFSILTGIAEIIHRQNNTTAALMLNNIIMMKGKQLDEYISNNISSEMRNLIFFAHVGKSIRGDVFFSSPYQKGSHWVMIYIDLSANKWFYCDPAAWDVPSTLRQILSPVVQAVYGKTTIASKSFAGITLAHVHSTQSQFKCSKNCLANVPLQTCNSVCGVAVAIMGGIASNAPSLWQNVLNRNCSLPLSLHWLTSPSRHSDFLRHTVISWLLKDSIDLSIMGIDEGVHVAAATPKTEHSINTRKNANILVIPDDDDDDIEQAGSALSQGQEDMYQWQTVRKKKRGNGNKVSTKPKSHCATKSSQQGYKRQKRVTTHLAKEKQEVKKQKVSDRATCNGLPKTYKQCKVQHKKTTQGIDRDGKNRDREENIDINEDIHDDSQVVDIERGHIHDDSQQDSKVVIGRSSDIDKKDTFKKTMHDPKVVNRGNNGDKRDDTPQVHKPTVVNSETSDIDESDDTHEERQHEPKVVNSETSDIDESDDTREDRQHEPKVVNSENGDIDESDDTREDRQHEPKVVNSETSDIDESDDTHEERQHERKVVNSENGDIDESDDTHEERQHEPKVVNSETSDIDESDDTHEERHHEPKVVNSENSDIDKSDDTHEERQHEPKVVNSETSDIDESDDTHEERQHEPKVVNSETSDIDESDDTHEERQHEPKVVNSENGDIDESDDTHEERQHEPKVVNSETSDIDESDDTREDRQHERKVVIDDSNCRVKKIEDTVEDGKPIFFVGQMFNNLDDLQKAKGSYEKKYFCEIINKKSRTLNTAAKTVPKRVACAKTSLKYYSLLLSCKFSGKPQQLKDRQRNTKSFRQNCPFEIYVKLTEDGQALQVSRINEQHNHILSKTLYEHLPRQRRVPQQLKSQLEDSIKLKANKKLLQQKIQKAGLNITLKDISNMQQKIKKGTNRNDIEHVINFLKEQEGTMTEVLVDDEQNFQGLFYQDQYMREMYNKFPELLMVDATYKLLELRMPLYLLLVVDGDGLSEIVAMFVLAEETKQIIEASVAAFQKFNLSWPRTKVIMSDKDFTERDAFSKYFSGASLNICLYHTLRSMKREITCEKLGITSSERSRCLEIVNKMAYSKSPQQYEKYLKMLNATKLNSFIDYMKANWIPIKEQWVSCYKDETYNLGETTNNRIESIFSKIKSVCSKYASLLQFFNEFFVVLKSLRSERNHHYLMSFARKSVQGVDSSLKEFSNYLTPYAFEYVKNQVEQSKLIVSYTKKPGNEFEFKTRIDTTTATATNCTCLFMKRMGLPCKHIFKVRTEEHIPLFDRSIMAERWSIDYYQTVHNIRFAENDEDIENDIMSSCNVQKTEKTLKRRVLSQAQKFNKASRLTQILASRASEVGMKTFHSRVNVLEKILQLWQEGKEVSVSAHEESDNSVNTEPIDSDEVTCDMELQNKEHIDDKDDKDDKDAEEGKQIKEMAFKEEDCGDNVDTSKNTELLSSEKESDKEHKEMHDTGNYNLKSIKMPPKMKKRGRPKGAEVTVIGLPRTKKRKTESLKVLPFKNLKPIDKDKSILECLTNSTLATSEALAGKRLLDDNDIENNVHLVPDTVRDEQNIDINRVQKYFRNETWLRILSVLEKKKEVAFQCTLCSKSIRNRQSSIICERCLLWFHFSCTTLNSKPKARNWFCTICKSKYI